VNGPAPASGAMLAHLRVATRASHEAMEGSLGLLDETLDRDRYRAILSRFYGFWVVWEPRVALLLGNEAFTTPRRRLHLLAADLSALGLSAQAQAVLPRCRVPKLHDAGEALGSFYVMEGSTLGGRIIQRNVEHRLGDAGRSSSTYFAGYGSDTGLMWRSFLARLDQAPIVDAARIARGAVATFERLGEWLPSGGKEFHS
jgi:heme oxygenase